jgi:hypothetical protein
MVLGGGVDLLVGGCVSEGCNRASNKQVPCFEHTMVGMVINSEL